MTKFHDLGRTVAALACTALFSGACLLGAVAPAQSSPAQGDPTLGGVHAAAPAAVRVA